MEFLLELGDDATRGYRGLEQAERAITRRTVSEHRGLAELWGRLLTLYFDGMSGVYNVEDPDEDKRFARIVRLQFLALGLGHAKSALDGALAGSYHHSFFSIRYMAELLMQAAYVQLRPAEARRWYKHHAQPRTADVPPKFEKAFNVVSRATADPTDPRRKMIQLAYDIAKEMDRYGAHPSQETLDQTLNQADEHARIGARYDRSPCIAALDRGALLTLLLLGEVGDETTIPAAEWKATLEALWKEQRAVMGPYREEIPPEDATA